MYNDGNIIEILCHTSYYTSRVEFKKGKTYKGLLEYYGDDAISLWVTYGNSFGNRFAVKGKVLLSYGMKNYLDYFYDITITDRKKKIKKLINKIK